MSLRRILLVRTDRIGDVILATPVLTALRRRFPKAHLALLVAPYTVDVVRGHPDLDEILVDDARVAHRGLPGWWRLAGEIRQHRFDTALLLHPTLRLALAVRLAAVPLRVGSGYRAYQMLFNRRVYEHRKEARRHEVEYNLSLAEAIGATLDHPRLYLDVSPQGEAEASRLLAAWGWEGNERLVVIHPGSGRSARNWPEASYVALGQQLLKTGGVRIVVTGGKAEEPLVRRVVRSISQAGSAADFKPALFGAAGKTTLPGLAALLKRAALCISSSTGPMHMAAALGTPTLSFFCPIRPCRPERWGPYGNIHIVLLTDKPDCSDCPAPPGGTCPCMQAISVESAVAAAQRLLRR